MGRGGVIAHLREWMGDIAGMVFPNVCEVCARSLVHGERTICLHCLTEMPRTSLHTRPFTDIHRRLAGKAPIERGAAWFYYYRDNPYARMIQRAKYNSRPKLARRLGAMFAAELLPDGFFDGIDMVVPVPMHRFKQMRRGYNQAREVARGIAESTGIELCEALTATRGHSTQTRRNAFDRWLNTRGIYAVDHNAPLTGKHLLLVDDVLTTGATLTACAEAIHQAEPTATISVLTIGMTHL